MNSNQEKRDRSKEPSYTVSQETALLPFLLETLKGKSRNNVKSLLSGRLITVDGKPTSQYNTVLYPGQIVTVLSVPAPKNSALPFPILFEDENLIVVNKPSKLLTVSAGQETQNTAYRMVTDYVRSQHIDNRIFVIHRLDRDISGVLMFARNPETKEQFQSHWNQIITHRGYTAVAEGIPDPPQNTLRSYLIETKTHLIFSGSPGYRAKEAITNYQVVQSGSGYSLLNISIETDWKNQIRVQLKEIGHPVAGDKQYGAHTNPIGRLCLHAERLSFLHPVTGVPTTFTARTPRDFHNILISGSKSSASGSHVSP